MCDYRGSRYTVGVFLALAVVAVIDLLTRIF